MTIDEVREQRNALAEKVQELAAVEPEEWTDEKRSEWDEVNKEYEEKNDLLERMQRAADLSAKAEVRRTQPDKPENAKMDDGKIVIPARARGGKVTAFKDSAYGTAEEKAYRFGMWAIANASQAIGRPNQRAIQFCNDHMPRDLRAHSEGVNSQGGFLVHDEIDSDLIDLREQYGVARGLLRNVPMNSDTMTRTRRTGGLTANYVGEAAAGTESTKSWDQVTLVAKDLIVLATMSRNLSEDAAINVGNDLAEEIAYAFSDKEDDACFNGDGTSTYGGIRGFRDQMSDTTYQVKQANSGTDTDWSQVTLREMNDVVALLPQFAEGPRTQWVCSKAFFGQVMQPLAHAAGGNTSEHLAGGRLQKMFLGYPVTIAQKMPTSASTAEVVCLFGDFHLAADFGDRRQTTIDFSNDATVNSVSVFETNQIAVRGTERFDINVHDVGDSTESGPVVGLLTQA